MNILEKLHVYLSRFKVKVNNRSVKIFNNKLLNESEKYIKTFRRSSKIYKG